jgi:hypothetical protein
LKTADETAISKSEDWKALRRGTLYFLLLGAFIWIGLYSIWASFPYLEPGSDIVDNAKHSFSLTHPLFDNDAKLRILVFGNSKTLAGFIPKVFDANLARDGITVKAQSLNLAIPGDRRFVGYLAKLLAAGARPTHVLVQFFPIPEDHDVGWSEWIRHDKMIVDTLFPFRTLVRNFTLFVFGSIGHGGLAAFYRESAQEAEQVIRDRGYYFLKGQSHFPGDSLPDDYSLPTDTPSRPGIRSLDKTVPAYARLIELSKRYGFKVIFFPPAYRVGELAPAAVREPGVAGVADGLLNFAIVGDDYWLMPPHYFSDPVHPNRVGADIYTKRLAALLAPVLKQDDR